MNGQSSSPTLPSKQAYVLIRLRQAQAAFQAGAHVQAHALCVEVLGKDRANADALHIMAAVAAEQDRFADAEALVRQAIQLKPACPHCRNTLGNSRVAASSSTSTLRASCRVSI